jgi:hypothetical protein
MNSDRERLRLEKLDAILRENGVSVESARREERAGPLAARMEEWRRRPWKIRKRSAD